MQHSLDRDREGRDVGAAFADPAFAELKAQGAPFAVLKPRTGEVLWANLAAAAHWAAADPTALAAALFGTDGRGGWLDGLDRGLVPERPPRLARRPGAVALLRAWLDADDELLVGLAVPDVADGPDLEAWRRPAWAAREAAQAGPPDAGPGAEAAPSASEDPALDQPTADPEGAGPSLARRSQLAVLRDRLSRAVDGASSLRLLWRTDAAGVVRSLDAAGLARLGSPLRFDGVALPDAVAPFDPGAAERLRAALSARATWGGLAIALPVAAGAATVPLALSGSPAFGPDRAFAGFRGFGTVDLGALALAERPAPAASDDGATPGGGLDALPLAEAAPAADAPAAAQAPTSAEPPTPAPAPDGAPTPEDEPDGPPTQEAEPPPRAPDTAVEPSPAEPRSPANVVQFRILQGPAPGRFGAALPVPPSGSPAGGPGREGEAAPVPAGDRDAGASDEASPAVVADAEAGAARPVGENPGAGAEAPEPAEALSDELAFLALGEALRARIADPPLAAAPPDAGEPGAPPPPEEPAAPLLARLPIPVLAAIDGRTVFANAAAAARLGRADPAALLAATPLASSDGAGRLALRDPDGETTTVPARRTDVSWAGAAAVLWLIDEADERPDSAGAPPPSAAEDRSVELLDRVDDAVALLDAAGRLRRLNRRGEAWFGRLEAGRDFTELLAPESRPAALALLGEVRNQRDGLAAPPLRRDVVARTAGDGAVPMLLTLGRLGMAGFYATLRDVSALRLAETDRARTERDHARSSERLPELLARVSHEIRTPLGAILGFAEVMIDERFGPLGNARYKDYLKDIHASGGQVVALVDDLLDLTRLEAGQVELDVAPVDLNRVVAEAVAQMQAEAHRGRVIMRTSLAGRLPAVLADERTARQIVRNLLSNAVKFNEPGGQVIVSTAPSEAGGVLLRVRDTGVGMSDDEIAAALEPFGGPSRRASAQGNGLGLPLTRALVGANGASMTIRSRPREGTLVEVCFAPAEAGEARRPA